MKKFVTLSSMMVVTAAFFMLAVTPSAVAKDVIYSFTLFGPQTATNGTETISVSGGGSFDFTAKTVVAGGSFKITNSNGAVVMAGSWKATAFDSFCSRGGPSSSVQGGVLVIRVTLSPDGEEPITDVTMTINCLVGSGCSAVAEGVTVAGSVGDFATPVRGAILFHVNQ